jgi:hypothetical protein
MTDILSSLHHGNNYCGPAFAPPKAIDLFIGNQLVHKKSLSPKRKQAFPLKRYALDRRCFFGNPAVLP